MASGSYISPGATGEAEILDPSVLARRRRLAEALIQKGTDYSPIQSPWQGLARVAQAGLGGYDAGQVDKEESAARKSAAADAAGLFGPAPGAVAPATGVDKVAGAMAPDPAPRPPAPPTFVGVSGMQPSAAPKMNGSNSDFVSAMMPHAMEVSKTTGVDPRIIVAQAALETGWGKSAPGNNYFGIKSHGQAGGNTLATTENVNGQDVRTSASFRAFPDMGSSVAGYGDFINKNQRYAGLKAAQGLEGQADALQKSGYATDPQYGRKVLSIAQGLPSADMPAADAQPTQFQIPGQPPAQATVAGAMGAPSRDQLVAAQRVISNPYSTSGQKSVAQAMLSKALTAQEPKMTSVAPGGTLVDERTGKVIYTAPEKDAPTPDQKNYKTASADPDFQRYLDNQRKPLTPTLVSPGQTVLPPGEYSTPSMVAADPKGAEQAARQGREEAGNMRKEIHQLPSYKNYSQAQPVYQGMVETADRDSKASDLNLVYGLGKIMDPGSVVREGEIQMANDTQGLGDRLNGMIKGVMGGARLSPEARKQILTEAYGRMQSYEGAFGQDAEGYKSIVARGNMNLGDVLPNFAPVKPYEPKAKSGAAEKPAAIPAAPKGMPEGARQAPNQKWYVPDPARPGKYLEVQPDA